MARGRFITNTLGDSHKFATLKSDTHRCAYMLLITYADAEGRFIADPITLNGKLYTRLEWDRGIVTAALADMHRVGLITLYEVDGKPYGVVTDFHKHNTIRRKDDGDPKEEAPSRVPAPPEGIGSGTAPTPVPEAYRSHTGTTQAKGKGEGKGEVEGEGKARALETDDANSSESRHMEYLTTGHAESQTATPARAFFRRLIGTQNANHPQARDELTRWYTDHGEAAIRDLWAKAKDNLENKPRLFWFIDALNGLKGTATIRPGATALSPEEERAFWGTN